ncbi:hypothetical protein COCVIDRAFT_91747, partial [Bipolaris victoriae FI3]
WRDVLEHMASWELACWKFTVRQMALDQQHKIWKTQFLGLSHRNRLCRDRCVDRKKTRNPLKICNYFCEVEALVENVS